MTNRLILGIDNSMDFLSLVLSLEDRLIEERHLGNKRAPSETVPMEVIHMLSGNGYTIDDVGLVVVTLGPGSFTGIRVGLAFCKGLHAGNGTELVGAPTLDVLASPFSVMEGYYLCPVIDAKKGEVFTSLYQVSKGDVIRIDDYRAMKPADMGGHIKTPCLCFGTGAVLCAPLLSGRDGIRIIREGHSRISGEALIREGMQRSGQTGTETLQPIYCRRSEAEIRFNVAVN